MSVPVSRPAKGKFGDHYTLQERLGEGAYAIVFKCVHVDSQKTYAVKVVDKTKAAPKDVDDIEHEITIMSKVGYHPYVMQMIEYFATAHHLYIVLDLLSGGMLFDRIIQLKHYSEKDAALLVRNMLSALEHVHSKGICHRDLKPENLLLRRTPTADDATADTSYLTDVCLADFGLAGYVPCTTCCGSPAYIAPEVINVGYFHTRSEPYNEKCDIWSLGVITYILLSGKMPFQSGNFKDTFRRVVANQWSFNSSIWQSITPAALDFIRGCLTPEPDKRPSATELLKHHWIAEQQPDVHLKESQESLRKLAAQQKWRAAMRVFGFANNLLGGRLNHTPPFMRYLKHEDKYSTVVLHQSQTDPSVMHTVDFGKALLRDQPGWRLQSCCSCGSEQICRHIQNVHEYLFVGKRSLDVFPFMDELDTLQAEAEDELSDNADDAEAKERLNKVRHCIDAANAFSQELAKIPMDKRKPNLMLEGSTLNFLTRSSASVSATSAANANTNSEQQSGKPAAGAEKFIAALKAHNEARKQTEAANDATPKPTTTTGTAAVAVRPASALTAPKPQPQQPTTMSATTTTAQREAGVKKPVASVRERHASTASKTGKTLKTGKTDKSCTLC